MHRVGVRTYNRISPAGLELFSGLYEVGPEVHNPQVIVLRSHKLHPSRIPGSVVVVARAGVGYDNVPVSELTARGVVVLNTPGGNANAVAELVAIAWGNVLRNFRAAMSFVRDLKQDDPDYRKRADEGKSTYAGNEMKGKTLGVIGLGAIGRRVASFGLRDEMEVYGYDPHLTIDGAWAIDPAVRRVTSLERLLSTCDLISLNLPLTDDTRGLIGDEQFALMRDDAILLNYAREELVQTDALLRALDDRLRHYATDFPMPEIHQHSKVSATPHLGASTEESEELCASRAVQGAMEYIERGAIGTSVNFPSIDPEGPADNRLVVLHENRPMMVAGMASAIGEADLNISRSTDRSKGDAGVAIFDVDGPVDPEVVSRLEGIDGVYKVRYIA